MALTHLSDYFIYDRESVDLDHIVLSKDNRAVIQQLLKEHRHADALKGYGLPINNKVLLYGHSGCGKTTTAKGIATALGKPIMIVNLSQIVNAKIGETSQNVKALFDKAARDRAILFLDEFDLLGKARMSTDSDVGEMKRLVNAIIQLIDYFPDTSLLLCATNHVDMIDTALLRRFQLRIAYEMPEEDVLDRYYDALLSPLPTKYSTIQRKYHISFAEAKDTAYTQVKSALLDDLDR